MRNNQVIRMLPAAVALSFLSSCGSSQDPGLIIDHEGRGEAEYTVTDDALIARLRCNTPQNDATCERVARRGCEQLGAPRAKHLGSHRVEWPAYASAPFPARKDSTDWMWVVLCE
jgi:hypothetical protein